jgi:hypothetical protein
MNAAEQVQAESRVRLRYSVLAALAGVLIVAQAAIQLSGPHTNVDELTLDLLTAHRRFPIDLIGAIVDAFALVAVAATLHWLHQVSRARSQSVKDWIRWLAVTGALLSGLMAVGYAVVIAIKANQFATTGHQTYLEANRLTSGGLVVVFPLLAQLGSLLLTGGFIWISINGMRVGLLPRFMGYLGVLAGALVLFPIGSPVPIVQGFWLVGLAVLFAGRWPSGTPEAWRTGVAVPWAPVGAPREAPERRQRPARGGAGARGGRAARAATREALMKAPGATAVAEPPAGAESGAAPRTRSSTPKRKRKKRGSR